LVGWNTYSFNPGNQWAPLFNKLRYGRFELPWVAAKGYMVELVTGLFLELKIYRLTFLKSRIVTTHTGEQMANVFFANGPKSSFRNLRVCQRSGFVINQLNQFL